MKLKPLDGCFYLLLSLVLGGFFPSFSPMAMASPTPRASDVASPPRGQVGFDHVEDTEIVFNSSAGAPTPKPLKTGLFELNFYGALIPTDGGTPYFLFSGKPCRNCMDERNIYAIRPTGGKPTAFVYPGKIFEPKSRAVLLDSRAFFGKCLPRRGDVYVVFQKERVDRRRSLQSSVLIVEAAKNYLAENLIERHLPNIGTTLQMVKRKSCKEIEGRNRLMLSKPLDLHPHSNSDNDDEESDNDKETDSSHNSEDPHS